MSSSAQAKKLRVPPGAPQLPRAWLTLNGKSDSAQKTISRDLFTIGRGEDNQLCLNRDLKISRYHAEIRFEESEWWLNNISQKNVLLVNGEPIKKSKLKLGDVIRLGDTELKFHHEGTSESNQLSLAQTPREDVTVALTEMPNAERGSIVTSTNKAVPVPISEVEPKVISRTAPAIQPSPAPTREATAAAWKPAPKQSNGNGSRLRFYAIIAVAAIAIYFLFSEEGVLQKKQGLRTEKDVIADLVQSEEAIRELQKKSEKKGEDSPQYQMAEQHYLRGFRDYQQGQYARAMQSFQAALSFFPSHELARKYLVLSRRKFDEIVRYQMNRGMRYRAKNNFRLCIAAYSQVMIMVKDDQDPLYKEAKQYFDECNMRGSGR